MIRYRKILIYVMIVFVCLSCKSDNKMTRLILWTDDNPQAIQFINMQIDEYQQAHPFIEIVQYRKDKYELIKALSRDKTDIDLIRYPAEYLKELVDKKKIISLSDYINANDRTQFMTDAFMTCEYNHQLWGIPDNYGNHFLLYYNKAILKEPLPTDTGKLIEISKKYTDEANQIYGLVFSYKEPAYIYPWWFAFGGKLYDENKVIKLNITENENGLQFFYDLKFRYKVLPVKSDYSEMKRLFKNGHAAMMIDRDWDLADYQNKLGENLGIGFLPTVNKIDLYPITSLSTFFYGITRRSKKRNIKKAIEFLSYMTSEKIQIKWLQKYRLPSLNTLNNQRILQQDPLVNISWQVLNKNKTYMPEQQIIFLNKAVRPELDKLMDNRISAHNALENMQLSYESLK